MEQKLIKAVVRVGNSAGVVLPKEWLGGFAKVEIIKKPLNIKEDIFKILGPYLVSVLGIYLVGSYARGEQTKESDIDILVITHGKNEKINHGKYEIILISEEILEKTLRRNILPLLPMLREAKTILNERLIEKYKTLKLTKLNLKGHIKTTKSALRIQKEFINLAELEGENIADGIMYSLILRLREVYILDCLKNNKIPSTNGIKRLITDLTNSREIYNSYLRSKSGKKEQEVIKVETARKIYNYIKSKIKEQE